MVHFYFNTLTFPYTRVTWLSTLEEPGGGEGGGAKIDKGYWELLFTKE